MGFHFYPVKLLVFNLRCKLLLVIFLIICYSPFFAQTTAVNKDEDTWLWEISGNGLEEPSYLYGGIRILCGEDVAISENLKQKFLLTSQLVLEIVDSDNPKTTFGDLEAIMMKQKKLKDVFTAEEYAELKQFFKDSLEIDLESGFNSSLIPINYVLTAVYKMIDCDEFKPFDKEIRIMARQQGKEILGVETFSQHYHFFDSVPYSLQAKALLNLARSWRKEKALAKQLVTLYTNNTFTNSKEFIDAWLGGTRDFKDILITDRNKKWLPKIKLYAAQKPTFFAFGAGHLCGETGIVALLRAEGYTLIPLKN